MRGLSSFPDVREDEQRIREAHRTRVHQLTGAISLADRILQVRNQPGWQDFVKALEDMQVYRRQELELCEGVAKDAFILMGRCREISAILSLIRNTENNRQALAAQLKEEQDRYQALSPKLKETP